MKESTKAQKHNRRNPIKHIFLSDEEAKTFCSNFMEIPEQKEKPLTPKEKETFSRIENDLKGIDEPEEEEPEL